MCRGRKKVENSGEKRVFNRVNIFRRLCFFFSLVSVNEAGLKIAKASDGFALLQQWKQHSWEWRTHRRTISWTRCRQRILLQRAMQSRDITRSFPRSTWNFLDPFAPDFLALLAATRSRGSLVPTRLWKSDASSFEKPGDRNESDDS